MSTQALRINYQGAVGDILCLSPAIYDLIQANPTLSVEAVTPFREVLSGFGLRCNLKTAGEITITAEHYREAVREAGNKPTHVTEFFHQIIAKLSGYACPQVTQRPKVLLLPNERVPVLPNIKPYWVIFAGGKQDIPLKIWSGSYFQEVTNFLRGQGFAVVQTGKYDDKHCHLTGVTRWFDRYYTASGIRNLLRLICFSSGVICPITSGMHIAAAFDKPCVVIAGGREDPWWEAYNNDYGAFDGRFQGNPHRFLQTVGSDMPCCRLSGCWNRKFREDGVPEPTCDNFTTLTGFPGRIANCMLRFEPEQVIEAVKTYL